MDRDARLLELEARLRRAEDYLEIQNLLATYGPLVDSASVAEAAELWAPGGGYDFALGPGMPVHRVAAPEGIAALLADDAHMGLVRAGCSHFLSAPRIAVAGDSAEATAYTLVIQKEGDRWFVRRAAINHFALVRTAEGWRVAERSNRTLDGSAESHETMRRVLDGPAGEGQP